jgi:hypothetical protein
VAEHFGVQFAIALGGVLVIASTLAAAAALPNIRQLDRRLAAAAATAAS